MSDANSRYCLKYTNYYTDGVWWDLEEWFDIDSDSSAIDYAKEFVKKEAEPLSGVSSSRIRYLFSNGKRIM